MFPSPGRNSTGFPVYQGFQNKVEPETPLRKSATVEAISETDHGDITASSVTSTGINSSSETAEIIRRLEARNRELFEEKTKLNDRLKLVESMLITENISHKQTKQKLAVQKSQNRGCQNKDELSSNLIIKEALLSQEQECHKKTQEELSKELQKLHILENSPVKILENVSNQLLSIQSFLTEDNLARCNSYDMVSQRLQHLFVTQQMFQDHINYNLSQIFNNIQAIHSYIRNGHKEIKQSYQKFEETSLDSSLDQPAIPVEMKLNNTEEDAIPSICSNMVENRSSNSTDILLPTYETAGSPSKETDQPEQEVSSDDEPIANETKFPDHELKFIFMSINQFFTIVEDEDWKLDILSDICENLSIVHALVFCKSQKTMEWLTGQMQDLQFQVCSISQDVSCEEMNSQLLKNFTNRKCKIFITTDRLVALTGIQLVPIVINYDLPRRLKTYIHRASRCRPMGRKGVVINLVMDSEKKKFAELQQFYKIKIAELPANIADVYG